MYVSVLRMGHYVQYGLRNCCIGLFQCVWIVWLGNGKWIWSNIEYRTEISNQNKRRSLLRITSTRKIYFDCEITGVKLGYRKPCCSWALKCEIKGYIEPFIIYEDGVELASSAAIPSFVRESAAFGPFACRILRIPSRFHLAIVLSWSNVPHHQYLQWRWNWNDSKQWGYSQTLFCSSKKQKMKQKKQNQPMQTVRRSCWSKRCGSA